MSLEDIIVYIIFILIVISILIMMKKINEKKYIFNTSDFTEILISCVVLGIATGTCYVLMYYAIFNEFLTESTSSLAIRLFSLLGGFYLIIKAFETYIKKLNEIFK